MPSDSPWPITLAALRWRRSSSMLLARPLVTAGACFAGAARLLVLARLALAARPEPSVRRAARARQRAAQRLVGDGAVPVATEATLFGSLIGDLLLPALHVARSGRRPASRRRASLLPLVAHRRRWSLTIVPMRSPSAAARAGRAGAAWALIAVALARAGRLPGRPDRPLRPTTCAILARRTTPTARSTSRCSARITRTWWSGLLLDAVAARAAGRRAHALPARRRAGRRAVLVRGRRARRRRRPRRRCRRRVTRAPGAARVVRGARRRRSRGQRSTSSARLRRWPPAAATAAAAGVDTPGHRDPIGLGAVARSLVASPAAAARSLRLARRRASTTTATPPPPGASTSCR